MLLLNRYAVDMGTGGLIIQAQSREEIYVDKLIAFALRPNRIKYRDLWDIAWLHQNNIKPNLELITNKLTDRATKQDDFMRYYSDRRKTLEDNSEMIIEFQKEMQRFLPTSVPGGIARKNMRTRYFIHWALRYLLSRIFWAGDFLLLPRKPTKWCTEPKGQTQLQKNRPNTIVSITTAIAHRRDL